MFYLYFLYLLTHTGVQHDFPVRWCWCHLTVTRRVAIVFCDFSKAFDKVWHRGLLHKMKAYGITGKLINWFKSYLKARRQKIVIKNNSSAYCEISAGVPQALSLVLSYLLSI